jgi:hypothetical protein
LLCIERKLLIWLAAGICWLSTQRARY